MCAEAVAAPLVPLIVPADVLTIGPGPVVRTTPIRCCCCTTLVAIVPGGRPAAVGVPPEPMTMRRTTLSPPFAVVVRTGVVIGVCRIGNPATVRCGVDTAPPRTVVVCCFAAGLLPGVPVLWTMDMGGLLRTCLPAIDEVPMVLG